MEKADFIKAFNDPANKNALQIAVVVAVVFLILLLLLLKFLGSRRGQGILLVGTCGSGKTQLWSSLLGNSKAVTVTSQTSNHGKFRDEGKREWNLIDIPGFPRVRYQQFEENRSQARGIVFVVDSCTLQKEIRDVAEFLYLLLTDTEVRKLRPKLAVFCNKQDMPLSKSESFICTQLEREITTLRMTKASQLESLSSKKKDSYFLGKEGKDFTFSDTTSLGIDVSFLPGSVTNSDLTELYAWFKKL